MEAICKEVFKTKKNLFVPGEKIDAIYSENGRNVDLFFKGRKIITVDVMIYKKHFEEC